MDLTIMPTTGDLLSSLAPLVQLSYLRLIARAEAQAGDYYPHQLAQASVGSGLCIRLVSRPVPAAPKTLTTCIWAVPEPVRLACYVLNIK